MTPEEHQAEHVRLHRALDELAACYFTENSSYGTGKRVSIYDPLINMLGWAHQKTMLPSPVPEEAHNARSAEDLEAQRQMILLALAELALSRPGWENSIREIARHYDGDQLEMFEGFKKSNADRVKQTHGALG